MGSHRFRLSNIIPNSWFYSSNNGNKVKNKLTKTQPITTSSSSSSVSSVPSSHPTIDQRKSYYFTRELNIPDPNTTRIQDPSTPESREPNPRRKSLKKKRPVTLKKPVRRQLVSSEVDPAAAARCSSCRIAPESVEMDYGEVFSDNEVLLHEQPPLLGCPCNKISLNEEIYEKVDLPRIITKQVKQDNFGSGKWVVDKGGRSLSVRVVKEGIIGSPVRKAKGKGYSPRLANRVKVNGINSGRRRPANPRGLSGSLAVVKTTANPERDFKESMVEMIVENNMKSSKELEDLLACYLALNSDEYHDLIIKVFKEIWFECTNIRL